MSWSKRILLVRLVSYTCLVLAIVGFSLGISMQHYALITVSFVAALVALAVGLSANVFAELIFQWRASVVRIASLIVFIFAIFGFSLGTNFQNSFLITVSFVAALIAIGTGLNANIAMKLLFRQRNRSYIRQRNRNYVRRGY